MAKTERNLQIKRDRRHIVTVLNMIFPGYMDGEELYRTVLDMNPAYTRLYLTKDMHYLRDKGYVTYRRADGTDALSITVKDCQFKLTANGTDVANQIVDDPALDI
ncbi:MAG: hypothetical protein H6819_06755 [Phycisphaerales bacterium]|nr:hypothetical protein [Phycisphaerales bacterium]MCB9855281.1 hypothetical protein [Phycisphaerales bacterium]MCB9862874.1 hypothetical protein [Phycisphaerales bacterium]